MNCEEWYIKLHSKCEENIRETFKHDATSVHARAHSFIDDFYKWLLFMKYRSRPNTNNEEYSSWQFTFSENELDELKNRLGDDLRVVLVCGCDQKLNDSEIAVLDGNETETCLFNNHHERNNLTIGRRYREWNFRISMGGGRDNDLLIRANKIDNGQL